MSLFTALSGSTYQPTTTTVARKSSTRSTAKITTRITTKVRTTARFTTTILNINNLKQDLNKLFKNKESISGVKNKIIDLTASSSRNNRDPPKDCSGVEKLVRTFTEKLKKNSKADVSSEYTDIKGVQLKAGSCKNSKLNTYVDELDTIINTIAKEITTLQDQLKGNKCL